MLSLLITCKEPPHTHHELHSSVSWALWQKHVCAVTGVSQLERAKCFTGHGWAANGCPGSVLLRENTMSKEFCFASLNMLMLSSVCRYLYRYEYKWRHEVEGNRESDIVLFHCCMIWIICLNFITDQCQSKLGTANLVYKTPQN